MTSLTQSWVKKDLNLHIMCKHDLQIWVFLIQFWDDDVQRWARISKFRENSFINEYLASMKT